MKVVSAATGAELTDMISRRRDDRLREARGIFLLLERAFGYTQIQLQEILKQENTLISRMAESAVGERAERMLRKVRAELLA